MPVHDLRIRIWLQLPALTGCLTTLIFTSLTYFLPFFLHLSACPRSLPAGSQATAPVEQWQFRNTQPLALKVLPQSLQSILLATLLSSPLPTQLENTHMLGLDPLVFCFNMLTSHHHHLFTCQCSNSKLCLITAGVLEALLCPSHLLFLFQSAVCEIRSDSLLHRAHSCAGWYLA